jgi:hypothetical protein
MSYMSSRPLSSNSVSTSTSNPSMSSHPSNSSAPLGSPQSSSGPGLGALHCSLFLFDDKLMVVKRQSSAISGRKVTGLDDVPKLVKSGGGVAIMDRNGGRKDKLSFRGVVDVLDIIATDVGNGGMSKTRIQGKRLTCTDFHLFLERPPIDQSDRWSSRPFRSYSTVHPPYAISFDPIATRRDKLRFVQNLWAAQALARAKLLPHVNRPVPRVLMSDSEVGLEGAGEMLGRAKLFWNVWERQAWAAQKKKVKSNAKAS